MDACVAGSPTQQIHTCQLPGYLSDGMVDTMLKYGMYSSMTINPIDYWGYRRTEHLITSIIQEIKFELDLRPQDMDVLLDHINLLNYELTLLGK